MTTHVLRIQRTDKSGQHLLLHVTRSGSKALDLRLVGTEHDYLYHLQLQESDVKSNQASNYSGDLSEWKTILKYALLREKPTGPLPSSLLDIETVGAIKDSTLTVTLRKNIEGITQRLGSIKLNQTDDLQENFFDWVDTAVAARDALRTELDALHASVSQQQEEVARLTKQLDELVQAKKDHEEGLLKKFAALLNAKKLKIRDQQHLLASAKVDHNAAKAVNEARYSPEGKRGKGKRKAEEEVEEESEDGFEDRNANGEDAFEYDEVQQETPPRSDAEETEEGEEDLDVLPMSNARLNNQRHDARGKEPAMDVEMREGDISARRELPAALRGKTAATGSEKSTAPTTRSSQAAPLVDGDDDETEDEL